MAVSALFVFALCWLIGGWPFALIVAVALICSPRTPVVTSAISLFWLAMFALTGDRRLFFSFAIQYALQVRQSPIVVLAFLLIRVAQGATLKVLLVEAAVAVAVVLISTAAMKQASSSKWSRVGWAAFGSLLAYLGLAL